MGHYYGYIGVRWDDGKETGNYYLGFRVSGFRVPFFFFFFFFFSECSFFCGVIVQVLRNWERRRVLFEACLSLEPAFPGVPLPHLLNDVQ